MRHDVDLQGSQLLPAEALVLWQPTDAPVAVFTTAHSAFAQEPPPLRIEYGIAGLLDTSEAGMVGG